MTTILLSIVLQVLALHPAGNPDGKVLTMHQAVSGFGVSPKNKAYHWEGDHDLKEGPGAFPRPRKYILPKEEKEGVVIGESVSRNEFTFSVDKHAEGRKANGAIYSVADSLMRSSGKTVQVRYKEYRGALPWRGVQKYVVTEILSVSDPSPFNTIPIAADE